MRSSQIVVLLLALTAAGGEVEEVRRLAPKYEAETEVRLWDGRRVDMVTPTHAIEVDWAAKWTQGFGQAASYAIETGKAPGLVLLVRDYKADARFIYQARAACVKYGIKLWLEKVDE